MKLFTRKQLQDYDRANIEVQQSNLASVEKAYLTKYSEFYRFETEGKEKKEAIECEIRERALELARLKKSHEETMLLLNEQRQSALRPITDEIAKLEALKLAQTSYASEITDKLLRNEKVAQENRQLLERIGKEGEIIKNMSLSMLTAIEERRVKAEDAEKFEKQMLLIYETKKAEALEKERLLAEKEESLKRTEVFVRGQMDMLDLKIAAEKAEQKKVDDKRQMLKVAIDVAKKKGIWSLQLQEMITK